MAIPQSTDTLLTFANSIYLEVNESPQTSTNNSLGTRMKSAISSAITDLCTLADWPWMQSFQTAASWVNEIATLPTNVRQIKFVIQERANASARSIPYVDQQVFYQGNLTSFTGAGGGIVRGYTQLGHLDVGVNPYPADSASQAELKFYVIRFVTLPSSDSSLFDIPDQYMELLRKKAAANFALSHLADIQLSGQFNAEYGNLAQRYTSSIRNTPHSGSNMYRNFRN